MSFSSRQCLLACLLIIAWPIAAAPVDPALRTLDSFVEAEMSKARVPGLALAVVKEGKVIHLRGYGYRDVERKLPVTPRTVFAIGSITKSFTVLTLGTLVQEGRLDWDRPVRRYLPELVLRAADANDHATLRDLVSHRSGLPRHDLVWYGSGLGRDALIERLRYLDSSAALRSRYQYNNVMFVAAAHAAERVTGESWESLVTKRVLAPLNLRNTYTGVAGFASTAEPALPYRRDSNGDPERVAYANIDAVGPSGSINSSVEDMSRYLLAQLGDGALEGRQVLDARTVREMRTPQIVVNGSGNVPELGPSQYGMGLSLTAYRDHPLVSHNGGIDGFSSRITWMPQQRIGVVILTNQDYSDICPIVERHIDDLLLGLEPIDWSARYTTERARNAAEEQAEEARRLAARGKGTHAAHDLDEYAGTYEHAAYGTVLIERSGASLSLRFHGMRADLQHGDGETFEIKASERDKLHKREVTFTSDTKGGVTSLAIPLERAVADIVFVRRGLMAADDAVDRYLDLLPAHSQLAAAGAAPALAWVERRAGRQSVWMARGTERRVLQRYEDDGQPVTGLVLSPDASWVAYLRGTLPNSQGEVNNPLDLPDPQERALWLSSTDGDATARRIAGGPTSTVSGPAFSPDGKRLVWTAGKEVWGLNLEHATSQPERLFTIRGSASQLVWSPDGRQLAFVSLRGTHSFIGIFDIGSRELRYLAPSLHNDQLPAWSPSGRYLAFVRMSEEAQVYRFTPRLESIPWSIQLADAKSGVVRTLWTADPGAGSTPGKSSAMAAGENAVRPPLLWTHDEHLVFSWEKTGWAQLYRLGLDGGAPQPLTRGDGEVWSPAISTDGRSIYYLANARAPERFELFRVPAAGGASKLLSDGYGVIYGQAPLPLPDGQVAFLGFNARAPAQILVSKVGDTLKPLVPDLIPRDFPSDKLTAPSVVELQAEDGLKFRALLYQPIERRAGEKRPAVVYVHGGSRSIQTEEPNHGWGLVEALVMRGYVVLVPNYRSGVGYGLKFRETPTYGGSGGSDTLDAIASGRYLAALPQVDPARIGIFGISYGGYLTTAALARAPDLWAAGASLVGVADWQMELELDKGGARLPMRLSQRMKYEELAHESSANAHLDNWRAPILFISGDDDRDGWLVQAIQLGQSLRRRGVAVEAMVEPGGSHAPATHRQLRARVSHVLDFFERRLAP